MAGPETDSAKPKPDAAKTSAAGGGDATRYVGTPAVGTSKAAASAGLATVGPEASRVNERRRRLVWVAVTGFLGAWFIAFLRFFLPRTLFEPPTVFKIGYASDYALGVDTKWQQKYRTWAVHPIGRPARTSSSVPATGAATTVKVSTLRGRRRVRWIARTWNWRQTVRSSWILPGSISGPRDNPATSATLVHFCKCNSWRFGSTLGREVAEGN